MVSSMGIPALSSEWTNWHLSFARQPESDLEFSDEDLDEAVPPPAPPMNTPKRSGKGPLLWILLLVVVGGIGYVAMDPDGAMQLIEPYLDGGAENSQPAPRTAPNNTQAPTVIPPELIDKGSSSLPEVAPTPPVIADPATPTVKPAPAFVNVAGPQFSEGHEVLSRRTVVRDTDKTRLSQHYGASRRRSAKKRRARRNGPGQCHEYHRQRLYQ